MANGREIARRGRLLGHELHIDDKHQRSRAVCSCGYVSTWRQTRPLAAGAAIHHLTLSVQKAEADGVSYDALSDPPSNVRAIG
jgi:hypothetical protein